MMEVEVNRNQKGRMGCKPGAGRVPEGNTTPEEDDVTTVRETSIEVSGAVVRA
jgi:hypothetical protein